MVQMISWRTVVCRWAESYARLGGLLSISWLLVVVFISGVLLSPATAQTAPETPEDWQFDYQLFQMIFEHQGLQIESDLNAAMESPQQSVVVLMNLKPSMLDTAGWIKLRDFVSQGGSLLLTSDHTLSALGFGEFVAGPAVAGRAIDRYQGYGDCVILRPRPGFGLDGVNELVTNCTGWLLPNTNSFFNWSPIAALPSATIPQSAAEQTVLAFAQPKSIQTRMTSPQGRVIACADPSLFSNGMLWHGQNAVAAIRISQLLVDGPRTKLVFVATGNAQSTYREQIPMPSDPDGSGAPNADSQEAGQMPALDDSLPAVESDWRKLLRLFNAVGKEVATSNVLNEALRQQPRNISPIRYFRFLAGLVGLATVIGLLWLILLNRQQRLPLLGPRKMRLAFEMREVAASDPSDFRVAACGLAREFCAELTGSRNSGDWQKLSGNMRTAMPHLSRQDQIKLAEIVDLACRGGNGKQSLQEFHKLGVSIEQLRAKHGPDL